MRIVIQGPPVNLWDAMKAWQTLPVSPVALRIISARVSAPHR